MIATEELAQEVGLSAACRALTVPRASVYRRRQLDDKAPSKPRKSHRALSEVEQKKVLDTLDSPRFIDRAPVEVYATLLDENVYLCSIRTMYRILDTHGQVRERRNQLRHPKYEAPELLANGPNQLWSWDITKLKGPQKWHYYYLYVILDVFSRYVVGWMVAEQESSVLANRLIAETIGKQELDPNQLVLHADRGSSMKSKLVAQLLADLGVTKTHSRPHTSNDNPFSESQFKTMKYRPGFPKRFGSLEDAVTFCRSFFPWYNKEHHHSGIALLTPEQVHHGRTEAILDARQVALNTAYQTHPERFPKPPSVMRPRTQVWINPPQEPPQKQKQELNP
jgi:putative transposase